jgi:hypothetical protein
MAPYLSSVDKPVQAPAPPDALAATPGEGPTNLPGTIANAPSPVMGRLLTKTPTFKQADMTDKANRAQQALDDRTAQAGVISDLREKAITQAGETARARIEATQANAGNRLMKVETPDANGNITYQYLPASQVHGKTFQKAPNAALGNRLASADAAVQTGNDIIKKMSDPAYAQNLGVAMGRYTNFEDFLGNPPPEYSELAGEIKSYAASNLGIHGMRSGAVFDSIQKMLGPNHEPANIAATIKGINGFSERLLANAGRTPGGGGPAAGGGPAGAPKVGSVVTVKGKNVRITAIHPDGTFDGDEVK